MEYHTDYKVRLSKACFDEMGFPDYCEGEKRDDHWNYYTYDQDSVLYFFEKLRNIDFCTSFHYEFELSNISRFYVEYDDEQRQIKYRFLSHSKYYRGGEVTSGKKCETKTNPFNTVQLDKQCQIIKDSIDVKCTCDDILCTDRKRQTTYRYDSKGNMIELGPEGMVSFSYSENGNLTKMELGKLFSVDYKYKDQKLSRIQVNNAVKTGLQAIELSFY